MAAPEAEPNFFIIGAPKCGTTALSEYLRTHPQIFVTDPKEPNFFNRDFDYFWWGDPDSPSDYLRLFEQSSPQHVARGEASVWYLHSKVAAERIHAFAPDARLIAMIRNPLELVHSLHSQLVYTLDEDQTDFERAWRLQEERRAGRSLPKEVRQPAFLQYAEVARVSEQLERFLRFFSREQLLIIVFDDFRRDPGSVYQQALRHLGLDDDGRTQFPPVNESKVHRSAWLSRFTQRPPKPLISAANRLKRLVGIERLGLMMRVQAVNRQERQRAPLADALVNELRLAFEPEVAALSELIGRDLSAWNHGERVPEPEPD